MSSCLFDTNVLLMPFEFKINPYKEIRNLIPQTSLITLEKCVNELKELKPQKWEEILSIGKINGLKIVKSNIKGLSVDDSIVKYAKKHNCLVATQDKFLKKKLLNNSLRLVVLRQKKYFIITG